jgi:hypothetical protein
MQFRIPFPTCYLENLTIKIQKAIIFPVDGHETLSLILNLSLQILERHFFIIILRGWRIMMKEQALAI